MASRADRHASVPDAHDWTPSGGTPPPCADHHRRLADHSDRINRLADKLDQAEKRLNSGDVTFAELRKDIHTLTESVTGLTGSIRWVGGLIIAAVITAVLSQVLK